MPPRLAPEYAKSASVAGKFQMPTEGVNVWRDEIEQNVQHRYYILLDISKVLLKMYSKGFLFSSYFSCPAKS